MFSYNGWKLNKSTKKHEVRSFKNYYQFNTVNNIYGIGAGVFKRVTSFQTNSAAYTFPANTDNKGAIQFNTLTKTFEGNNVTIWQPFY